MPAPANQTDATALRSAPPLPRTTRHPGRAHLDALIRAEVVTHLISADEMLDPLYAVSQMRDMAEVRFVAAFRDGLIALGCPEGVPDELKGIATRAFPLGPPPQPDQGLRKLDRLAKRVEFLLEERPAPIDMGALDDRLARIEKTTPERAIARAIAPLTDQIGALHYRLDQAEELPGSGADLSPILTHLNRMEKRLASIEAAGAREDSTGTIAALREDLQNRPTLPEGLCDDLAALPDRVARIEAASLAASQAINDQGQTTAVLSMIVNRTEAAAEQVSHALEQAQSQPEVTKALEGLSERVERLATPDDAADMLARIETITHTLDQRPAMQELLAPLAAGLESLHAEMTRISSDHSATPDTRKIHEALALLTARPAPLTETQLTAILEDANTSRHTEPAMAEQQEILASIAARLEQLAERPHSLQKVLETLSEDIAALTARPDLMRDLADQKQAFARLSTAMGAATAKLETLGTAVSESDAATRASLRALPGQLRSEVEKSTDPAGLHAACTALRQRLETLPTAEDLGGLDRKLDGLTDRADPGAALMVQHENLHHLSDTISMLVDRLDLLSRDPALADTITAEGDRLSAALTQVERRLTGLAQDQSENLAALAARVEASRRKSRRGPDDAGPFGQVRAKMRDGAQRSPTTAKASDLRPQS